MRLHTAKDASIKAAMLCFCAVHMWSGVLQLQAAPMPSAAPGNVNKVHLLPLLLILLCLAAAHVKYQFNLLLLALQPLTAGDCSEALLPCCVPYLQLHPLVVQEDLLDLEVNAVTLDNAKRVWNPVINC